MHFPTTKLKGTYASGLDAVLGVMINIDGVESEMTETIKWKDLAAGDLELITEFVTNW